MRIQTKGRLVMRTRKRFCLGLLLLAMAPFNGGCIDGFTLGVQAGVEDAVASTVESIVNWALDPLLPATE